MVLISLESRVREDGDSQEQRGDSTANVGDNGQNLLVGLVHLSPGDVLQTNTRSNVISATLSETQMSGLY